MADGNIFHSISADLQLQPRKTSINNFTTNKARSEAINKILLTDRLSSSQPSSCGSPNGSNVINQIIDTTKTFANIAAKMTEKRKVRKTGILKRQHGVETDDSSGEEVYFSAAEEAGDGRPKVPVYNDTIFSLKRKRKVARMRYGGIYSELRCCVVIY